MSQAVSQFAKEMMQQLDAIVAEKNKLKKAALVREFGDRLFAHYSKKAPVKDYQKAAANDHD